ncbi:hypothetical protein CEXT_674711 [Caerostris extrusa]|uniref:Uncharacterized protein n=1 Tax=Caerostris extrusa TaxID=172846 RepID=A0AAV4NC44_CAEEX|nr:hypothetical protein CEXT_674711 [Caerostris extrusa]
MLTLKKRCPALGFSPTRALHSRVGGSGGPRFLGPEIVSIKHGSLLYPQGSLWIMVNLGWALLVEFVILVVRYLFLGMDWLSSGQY